jgi:hypothetical protein
MSGDVNPALEQLHLRARELISTGVLPTTAPDAMFGGLGSESVCALCSAPILPAEVTYELEYRAVSAVTHSSSRRLVRFHLACRAIWDYERVRA